MDVLETGRAIELESFADPADEPCTAEKAECTCPDFCERDHANE